MAHPVGRNDPCPCGSGRKYKSCCANKPAGNVGSVPTTIPQMLQLGMQYRMAGRFAEAGNLFNQVLKLHPDHPDALHQLGIAAAQQNQFAQAETFLRRAIAVNPKHPTYLGHLGNILCGASRFEDAIPLFKKSIDLKSDDPVTWYNYGNALFNIDETEPAINALQKAISLKPDYALAHNAIGNAYYKLERFADALPAFQKAYQLSPNITGLSQSVGNTLAIAGRVKEAVPYLEKALKEDPDSEEIPFDLAKAYDESSRLDLGIDLLKKVLQRKPNQIDALLMLDNFYSRSGLLDEALAMCKRVLDIDPGNVKALTDYGTIVANQGDVDQAIKLFQTALENNPDRWEIYSIYLYFILFHPDYSPEQIAEEHRKWNEKVQSSIKSQAIPALENRDPNRRLKIGYVSADYSTHVIGRNMIPVFREHNRSQFEIYAYSSTLRKDELTNEFEKLSDHWRDISHSTDDEALRIIRNDKLDILIDLTMHLSGSRLMVFAHKPAPIQFTFAAYPGTTGLSAIDYRLTDPYLDPPGVNDQFYSEKTVQLPDTFWCFQETTEELPVNDQPAIKNGYVTFGCLNSFFKINPFTFNLWSRVLNQVPNSRLMLLSSPGSHWEKTLSFFESQGIAKDRIMLVKRNKRSVYLQNYLNMDLGLDSYPYNGHSSSLDSYWMGVPVITLAGRSIVSRAGFSQLSNLKLTDFVAHNEDEFVKIAADIASDLPRLQQLRLSLRERMRSSPLMDAVKFTRGIEHAYRNAWKSAIATG